MGFKANEGLSVLRHQSDKIHDEERLDTKFQEIKSWFQRS